MVAGKTAPTWGHSAWRSKEGKLLKVFLRLSRARAVFPNVCSVEFLSHVD